MQINNQLDGGQGFANQAAAAAVAGLGTAGLDLHGPTPPLVAPTVALGAAGVLNGACCYRVSYRTAKGDTVDSPSSITITPASQQVLVTLPVSPDPAVVARRVWRSKVGDLENLFLVSEISDNTTTSYTDNTPDGSLGIASHYLLGRIGGSAPALMVSGLRALFLQNLNMFLGQEAGVNCAENTLYNLFVGSRAGYTHQTGDDNTFIGGKSGYNNAFGQQNTHVGANVAVEGGQYCSQNVIIGAFAGYNIASDSNTLVGRMAGQSLTTGARNIFIGDSSGDTDVFANRCVTGDDNVFIGRNAGPESPTQVSSAVVIGNDTKTLGSNVAHVGTSSLVVGYKSSGWAVRVGNLPEAPTAYGGLWFGAGTGGAAYSPAAYNASLLSGNGDTIVNALSGGVILRVSNVDKVTVAANGDVEVMTNGAGVIARSPDGTRYRLFPANGGGAATWVAA